jgi:hypothetical protein
MLKTLRTKTRKIMLGTLILVIPSFIFFYGWGSIQGKKQENLANEAAYGTFKTAGDADWVVLTREDLLTARYELEPKVKNYVAQIVLNRFQQFMPGQQPLPAFSGRAQPPGGMDALMPSEDLKFESINEHLLKRYAEQMGIRLGKEDLKEISPKWDWPPIPAKCASGCSNPTVCRLGATNRI